MKSVIFIVGLPGSGKTRLLEAQYNNDEYVRFDDFQANAVCNAGLFTFSQRYPSLIREMGKGERNIVISDIRYCNYDDYAEAVKVVRWWIENKGCSYDIVTRVFKNDPEKCRSNVRRDPTRNGQPRLRAIDEYTTLFHPPRYKSEILDVYFE